MSAHNALDDGDAQTVAIGLGWRHRRVGYLDILRSLGSIAGRDSLGSVRRFRDR